MSAEAGAGCPANLFNKAIILRPQQFSFWRGVGQVSDLPVDGVSDSGRGQRPLQPADQEVCPTLLAIMRIAASTLTRLDRAARGALRCNHDGKRRHALGSR